MWSQNEETSQSLEEDLIPNCGISFFLKENEDIDVEIFWNENKDQIHIVQLMATLCHLISSGKLDKLVELQLSKDNSGIGKAVIFALKELKNIKEQPLITPEEVF